MTTIEVPRAKTGRGSYRGGVNWEKVGWIYMRVSGVVLVVLIFGHLFVNLVMGEGVKQIDFAFIGGKLANPFWQWWDVAMLWLGLIHGGNGMRTLVNDYVSSRIVSAVLKWALLVAVVVLIILGTLVVFTFDPCPAGADPALLASFCPAS